MTASQPPSVAPGRHPARNFADANCIVLRLDARGRVIDLNPFGQEFFGYHLGELLGRPAVGTLVPQTDRSGKDLAVMIDTLLQHPDNFARQINENRRKSGERVWVVWSNRAFRDAAGRVTEILCVGNDITDRKTAEALLETSRERLIAKIQQQNAALQEANARLQRETEVLETTGRALQESMDRYRLFSAVTTEGILFHDNGILIDANQAFADMVGCPVEPLIGTDVIARFVVPEDVDQVRRRIAGNDDQVYEIAARDVQGRIFPAELRSRSGNLAGKPCRAVCIRDITHRKHAERQLIQSQKMEAVAALAGGIAHDFNNMLAGIQGNVDIVRHQLPPKSPHQKRLAIIEQIVRRGARLSGQLLGYARSGQTEISTIDLNQLVGETLEMFAHNHRGITIDTRLDPSTPTVNGDRTQIEQVLLNLMINAVHAMPTGGQLRIATGRTVLDEADERGYETLPGTYAVLSVSDSGHGMDRQTREKIFEPFFTTKVKGQGTGLGLASTYGIVKNHKGYIDVDSRPGAGSRFDVMLPAAQPQKTSAITEE